MSAFVPLAERFWIKVDKTDTCWLWTGRKSVLGYGRVSPSRRYPGGTVLAHRAAYEMLVGPIPEGLELDHLCRVRHCVNPSHLEPVTHAVNMSRGALAMRTACNHGHEFTEENTRRDKLNRRRCRTCERIAEARRGQRRREKERLDRRARLTVSDVRAIRETYQQGGVAQRQLAKTYGVSQAAISAVVLRKSWVMV